MLSAIEQLMFLRLNPSEAEAKIGREKEPGGEAREQGGGASEEKAAAPKGEQRGEEIQRERRREREQGFAFGLPVAPPPRTEPIRE